MNDIKLHHATFSPFSLWFLFGPGPMSRSSSGKPAELNQEDPSPRRESEQVAVGEGIQLDSLITQRGQLQCSILRPLPLIKMILYADDTTLVCPFGNALVEESNIATIGLNNYFLENGLSLNSLLATMEDIQLNSLITQRGLLQCSILGPLLSYKMILYADDTNLVCPIGNALVEESNIATIELNNHFLENSTHYQLYFVKSQHILLCIKKLEKNYFTNYTENPS